MDQYIMGRGLCTAGSERAVHWATFAAHLSERETERSKLDATDTANQRNITHLQYLLEGDARRDKICRQDHPAPPRIWNIPTAPLRRCDGGASMYSLAYASNQYKITHKTPKIHFSPHYHKTSHQLLSDCTYGHNTARSTVIGRICSELLPQLSQVGSHPGQGGATSGHRGPLQRRS